MKRLLLFLVLAGGGTALLLHLAGGLSGPAIRQHDPVVSEVPALRDGAPRLDTGQGTPDIEGIEGITQPAPPQAITWQDPLSEERVEVPSFTPWTFQADDVTPLQTLDEEQQGVRCSNVVVRLYRAPTTRAEAMALVRNEPDAYDQLLHQRFTAREAQVHGRLGAALARRRSAEERGLGDTELRLRGEVVIVDREQGLEVRGEELEVWPEQDRAEGDGRFTMQHEAFVIEGEGLDMERERAKGWSRITLRRHPSLRVVAEGRDKDGRPIFDFAPGDFRPLRLSAEGRAVLVRQEGRRETVLTVTLTDGVQAQQEGGRSLRAGRAELVASRAGSPDIRRGRGWKLQRFRAEDDVNVSFPGRTRRGEAYLTSARAERLIHEVPAEGRPATVLEGDVLILMRGEIPLLGPGGRLRLSCRDRAWIGPLPPGTPSAGLAPEQLQQVGLRGHARIERESVGDAREQDELEAEAIDLLMMPTEAGAGTADASMVAVHFAAVGDVRLGGTRLRGTTQRLVADDLHTERPRVTALGAGTRFEFPDLGEEQRLLGPAEPDEAGSAGASAATSRSRWALERLRAAGAVDVTTSLGGPALGIPAHLAGELLSYDRVSRRAQLEGSAPAPARIAWGTPATGLDSVSTLILTLDRAAGRLTARGGVESELSVSRGAGRSALGLSDVMPGRLRRGATLAVETDTRIEIELARSGTSLEPVPGHEQLIRIPGDVTLELVAADRAVDRMRARSLEVALVYLPPNESEAPASVPAARAGGAPRGGSPERARRPAGAPQRLAVRAGELQVDLQGGEVQRVEATGDVDLQGHEGHVQGTRATYEAALERMEVFGDAAQPAVAFLGDARQRSEVRAERLVLQMAAGQAARLEAHAPAGGTSEVQLYRDVPARPGELEWFSVAYSDTVVVTDAELRAGRVRVVRRLREPGAAAWGAPAVLWAPSMRLVGDHLLATRDGDRVLRRILAEGGDTSDVHFRSGADQDLVEVWGSRFDFDLLARRALLTGLPQRDVTMQTGGGLHSWYTSVTIDMNTNLPSYLAGTRILWRPQAPQGPGGK